MCDHYRDEAKKFFEGYAGGIVGSDRFHRNYWYFSCLPDVIVVETIKEDNVNLFYLPVVRNSLLTPTSRCAKPQINGLTRSRCTTIVNAKQLKF